MWWNISGLMRTKHPLFLQRLKLVLKGNEYNKHLYYIKNDSHRCRGDCLKVYLQSETLHSTGKWSNFFSDKHYLEKPEIRVSDADRLLFEEIPECTEQWEWNLESKGRGIFQLMYASYLSLNIACLEIQTNYHWMPLIMYEKERHFESALPISISKRKYLQSLYCKISELLLDENGSELERFSSLLL